MRWSSDCQGQALANTRTSGDEEITGKIKAALKASTKEIKKLIPL